MDPINNETQRLLRFAEHRSIRGVAMIVLVILALFLAAQTINTVKEFRFIGGGVPVSNVIAVSGEGEVFAVPDVATFSFSVIEEDANASLAQEMAAKKINQVLSFIERSGVEERDIKTTSFNLYPRYEFRREPCVGFNCPPSGERVLVGFEVNQSVEVKVRDTERAGEIIAGIGELGISNISGLSFTIDDEEILKAEARSLAIEDAKEKAEILAKDLDVSLVRIVSFNEFDQPVFSQRFDVAESAFGIGGAELPVAPELPLGENKIVSRVSITYEIR